MGVWLSEGVSPEVGMGATRVYWTDQRPYTIVEVYSDRCIGVRRCLEHLISDQFSQTYTYSEVADNPTIKVSLRSNGKWVQVGCPMNAGSHFAIGHRRYYYDPNF